MFSMVCGEALGRLLGDWQKSAVVGSDEASAEHPGLPQHWALDVSVVRSEALARLLGGSWEIGSR